LRSTSEFPLSCRGESAEAKGREGTDGMAVLDDLDDGMSPDEVARAYPIDLRLVIGVKAFAESQRFAHSV
jgi:hypothetical protein